ncbi:UDP-N-acetylmuramoyl-tripeptide--D-alanyl-D-alanine ligase [Nocardioides sp. LHD-245]|uniref:UDP-N-acetylmuramoyl-tripeptide--D-alanyl-D- alanine ligase n=1 Tax=Nocardioides sp. LHD-245 TaxID=3051387 RepID=UPI0027DEC8A4|nr:UDP-N-acetylmuramoyl-tripeptide--D-alanyl-D-alanine ligase [Nocardioides sp. LHD-245]
MIPLPLSAVAEIVGGTLHGADVTVSAPAYVDSRTPLAGGLFVAVVGERVDGHDYADGAHAVLGSRPTAAPTVVVTDPVAALGLLARHVLDRLDATVLAMTGSQGKTGTKDYLAAVLRTLAGEGAVVATAANNNNELGVPLTVLRADHDTRFLVVEMGARGVGHLSYLCDIAPPSIAAVLNVGTAHVGEFGGREQIARAKGELVEALPADGVAVLNADDALVAAMAGRTRARVLDFGRHDAALSWRALELDPLGRPSFDLGFEGDWHRVSLLQAGMHQIDNALAAAGLAIAAGFGAAEIAAALSTARPASRWRMEMTERADGLVLVNDAYNANPESMTAALEALSDIRSASAAVGVRRRTVAVLGEMKELGDEHDAGHQLVGRTAAGLGIDVVVVVGDAARGIAEGAADGTGEVIVTAGREEATAWVRQNAGAEDVVLVKASRGVALEVVAEAILTSSFTSSTEETTA